ncbi:TatD DNase family protein [Andreprevotia lacus DSM 23236]|jgi:TatD DNase family protein|uniref:TatD DNase family protein n=1 Tax=Andreprevotia lacus DSM 23236 TaxID=1121001 RepID=A0A1W1XK76_9NEIS|nr:TatD family hydrolase [Andreprevotia lacus]SMC24390.1 TatD DNase family protein [Andreprevotia lacus DSM 23236]
MPPIEKWIDSHCHLDAPEFAGDRDAVARRAQAAGVVGIVVPAITAATFADTLAMRNRYGAHLAFGLHPIYIDQHRDAHLAELANWLTREQPVAVGEIGLDFYVPELDADRQVAIFEAQLKLARDFDLPVIVHIRRSQDQVLKYLRKWQVRGGIAHAFNGSRQQADEFIKLGFKLGFGGAMTYSGSQRIRKLAAELPLDAIVLETDAPDIAPSWLDLPGQPRGRNEPAELPRIAAVLAELRQTDLATIAAATRTNTLAALPALAS